MTAYRNAAERPEYDDEVSKPETDPSEKGIPVCGGRLMPAPPVPHKCRPPGWWATLWNGVVENQIWFCGCGEPHIWEPCSEWSSKLQRPNSLPEELRRQGLK